jgi:hypothetical protein
VLGFSPDFVRLDYKPICYPDYKDVWCDHPTHATEFPRSHDHGGPEFAQVWSRFVSGDYKPICYPDYKRFCYRICSHHTSGFVVGIRSDL